jgi:hypothetical protein
MKRWINNRVNIEQENIKPYKKTSSWWTKFTLMSLFALSTLTSVKSLELSNNIVKRGMSIQEFVSLPNKANIPHNDFEKAIISLSGLDRQPDTMYQTNLQDYLDTIYGRKIDLSKYDNDTLIMLKSGKYDKYKMFTETQLNPEKMVAVYRYLNFVKTTPYFISGLIDMRYHNTLTMFKYSEKFRYTTKFGIYSLVYSIHHKSSKDTDDVINRIYCLDLLSFRSNGRVSNPKDVDNIAEFIILTDDKDTLSTCVYWLGDIPNAMSLARNKKIAIRESTTSEQPKEQSRVNGTTLEQPKEQSRVNGTTLEKPREQARVNGTTLGKQREHITLKLAIPSVNTTLEDISILNEVYGIYSSIFSRDSYSLFLGFMCVLICCCIYKNRKCVYPFRSILSLLSDYSLGMGIFITESQLLRGRLNRIVDEIENKKNL